MSKKIYFYKGKMPAFALPILIFLGLVTLLFFLFFGALAFLVAGALGIGAAFLRLVFGKSKDKIEKTHTKNNEHITLSKDDYEIIDIE